MKNSTKCDNRARRLAIVGAVSAASVGAALLGMGGAAHAEPGSITWTTYLYQGPSTHYQVADEVMQMQPVDIIGCADGWCHVSFEGRDGYVLAEVVVHAGQNPAAPPPGVLAQPAAAVAVNPRGPCFKANQKGGNGGNELTVFCQK